MKRPDHLLLLAWLAFAGLVVFLIDISIEQGALQQMLREDQSRICFVILLIYAYGVIHSFLRTLYLSRQLKLTARSVELLLSRPEEPLQLTRTGIQGTAGWSIPDGFVSGYIRDLMRTKSAMNGNGDPAETRSDLLEAYASRIRGAHEVGWFIIDLMLKIGFAGTVIGFMLMLNSVTHSSHLDPSMMQKVLREMSYGMGTALYTTLLSLITGILLAVPYQLLDRGLDDLVETTVYLTEVQILPRLTQAN